MIHRLRTSRPDTLSARYAAWLTGDKTAIIKNKIVAYSVEEIDMGFIGLGVSMVAVLFMFIGLIPFLGWLNWITTLPLAVVGATMSGLGIARSRSILGIVGLIISAIVFFIALARLSVGCGIF
jgi:hypothetical protein